MNKIDKARAFVMKVQELAKEMDLNYFVITDGASGMSNSGNEAIANARRAHEEWEKKNGFDPSHDWSK